MKKALIAPDAAAGIKSATITDTLPRIGDKKAVATLTRMSVRWVDGEMTKGMPHWKLGARRCRFDLDEVAEWLRAQYHTQRRGPAKV